MKPGEADSCNTVISASMEAGFIVYYSVISKLSNNKGKHTGFGLNVCLAISGSIIWGPGLILTGGGENSKGVVGGIISHRCRLVE